MTELLLVAGAAIAISFYCALAEATLLSVSLSYIGELDERGDPTGRTLARLREDPGVPLATLLTLNTIAVALGSAVAGARAFQIWQDARVAGFCLLLTLGMLLLGGILPRSLGSSRWRLFATFAAWTIPATIWLMRPLTLPLGVLGGLITPRDGASPRVSRAEFEVLAEIERRQGTLDEQEWAVVANVMDLDQIPVGDVMTPRTGVVAISIDASVSRAMDLMLEEGHLRMPVFEGSIDRIVGVLLARDLWRASREGISDIRAIVRPATFVPFTKPVSDLIRQMRELRIKMAIVLDEFGGTAGLATMEDLVEEIIGEIQDEHEQEPLPFEEEMEGEVRIRGEVPLWEVNERFGLDLPEDLYDTLGGFVFGQIGNIPDVGDEVAAEGGRFRVVAMDGRRVTRVAFVADTAAGSTSTDRSSGA